MTHATFLRLREAAQQQEPRSNEETGQASAYSSVPAARQMKAPFSRIELSSHYNAALDDASGWHDRPKNNLSELPTGVQTFAGVEFEVRGIVQLSAQPLKFHPRHYPIRVEGIRVGQRCAWLHFLHAAGFGGDRLGVEVAAYIVRYRDGQTQTIPVVHGEDVVGWWGHLSKANLPKRALLAWTGLTPENHEVNLFMSSFENPRPSEEVVSLDYVSRMTGFAPFLIAITVE